MLDGANGGDAHQTWCATRQHDLVLSDDAPCSVPISTPRGEAPAYVTETDRQGAPQVVVQTQPEGIRLSLDDAEAFFEGGVRAVRQIRRSHIPRPPRPAVDPITGDTVPNPRNSDVGHDDPA